MRFFWIILSLVLVFILEWAAGSRMAVFGVSPPWIEVVMVFWLWRLDFWNKILLAVIGGSLLDVFSPFMFGSVTSSLLVLAVLMEFLRRFLLNADSLFVRSAILGAGTFFALAMSAILDVLLYGFGREFAPAVYGIYAANFAGVLLWSVVFSFVYGGFSIFKKPSKRQWR